jgi:hypothetical protein
MARAVNESDKTGLKFSNLGVVKPINYFLSKSDAKKFIPNLPPKFYPSGPPIAL